MQRPWLAEYPAGVPAEVSVDGYVSLVDLLDRACERYATRIACTAMGTNLSYEAIDIHARRFAGWLQSLDMPRGSRVAVMLPNVPAYLACMLGTLRAGHVLVNVNPLYRPAELERQLRDAGAQVIVILENFAHTLQSVAELGGVRHVVVTAIGDLLGGIKETVVNLAARHVKKVVPPWRIEGALRLPRALALGQRHGFEQPALSMEDLAILQYTGGTTGTPKGAMLTHRNLAVNILQTEAVAWPALHDVPGQLTIISALPLYHVFAMTVCGLYGMHAGMRNLLILNPRDQPALIKAWRAVPVHIFPGVNTLFNALARNPAFASLDFSALRLTFGGGMAVQRAVADRWRAITGRPIIEGYGLSETSPVAAVNPTDTHVFSGTIGLPVPSTDVAILDDEGHAVPEGERGEVCIKGPQVMRGYWQRPDETRQVMTDDGYFRTGDIGTMDRRGYIRIVDRKKDMIVVSGFKVYPNEVEDVIATHPGVQEVAAVGVADERSGESVRVFVVPKDPSLSEADVLAWCRDKLTGYKRPRSVVFRTELPKTNVGKILRRELREAAQDTAESATAAS
ncbi:AMP-binding protein [Bordetella genomosp. 9]|uniref:Long-chain-fatty-acid--CoA ligase n=1 Tax=Bordetella genomosp. 9 TaxID=1416803 RepID=A0A1W6YXB1_9BORD|nr:AMP-binding protein [Bordetella genomosp. 9]ARP85631.1 long-chain fatty acid--CoA ligase [Bordetella genomosp. 9]ARP89605.1 long-chain fatty acid--CoA ligase [Bordetella genomosp. 9]